MEFKDIGVLVSLSGLLIGASTTYLRLFVQNKINLLEIETNKEIVELEKQMRVLALKTAKDVLQAIKEEYDTKSNALRIKELFEKDLHTLDKRISKLELK